jgi:predicted ATPase/class 3 adenylate cyclase
MADLPTGTLTYLFTDIEGHSRPWDTHPQAMRTAMARHDALLTAVFAQHDGVVVRPRGEGDSLFTVFVRASDAVAAALAGQRALAAEDWGVVGPLRVRMGLHTGEADLREGDYYGSAVNRCGRIRSAAYGGQVLLSTATATLVRGALPPDTWLIDVGRHRLRNLHEPEQLFQLAAPDVPRDFPPLKTLDTQPNNLPLQLTSFVGRERELTALRTLLQQARLVTLVGPGGTGKTRLALEAAAEALDGFPDGVFFVDLTPLGDPGLVAQTIARAQGLRDNEGRSHEEALRAFLRDKHRLLVLDNFEHLLEAAPLVADLLQACPHVRVLVTSREPLRLRGEQLYPVAPLGVAAGETPARTLVQSEGVQLFVERARARQPDFALSDAIVATVAAICTRLDGLPLAIELAAAHLRLLPPEALLARLERRLPLLVGGARDAPARQRTLRDTIGWSYELLTSLEQVLFRRLAEFAGGWTLDAAEAVWGVEGDAGVAVLEGLESLIDKSLVHRAEAAEGEPRFGMLETVREFAREQVEAHGEAEALRGRHLTSFLALAETAEPHLTSATREPWLTRLDAEQDNLRAALGWAVETGDVISALRLAGALQWYWFFRGRLSEGRRWLERALALPGAEDRTVGRAKALAGAWWLAFEQGERRARLPQLEECVAIWRQVGDTRGLAHALVFLGLAQRHGDATALCACFEESTALFRAMDDRWGLAHALYFYVAALGTSRNYAQQPLADGPDVRSLIAQSHALFRELDDPWGLGGTLWQRGMVAAQEGDIATAHTLLGESLAQSRRAQDAWRITATLATLADLAVTAGDLAGAVALYQESLATARELSEMEAIETCLTGTAQVLWKHGRPAVAVRMLATVESVLDLAGLAAESHSRRRLASATAPLRVELGEEAFAAAWKDGRALSLEQAILAAQEALAADFGAAPRAVETGGD